MRNKLSKIFLAVVALCISFLFIKGMLYKNEISSNNRQTVCKYVNCMNYPKSSVSFFTYYVEGKKFRNSYGQCPEDDDKKIDRFFILYYSSKDAKKIEVDFSKQVTDTSAIIKAGFSKADIQ